MELVTAQAQQLVRDLLLVTIVMGMVKLEGSKDFLRSRQPAPNAMDRVKLLKNLVAPVVDRESLEVKVNSRLKFLLELMTDSG